MVTISHRPIERHRLGVLALSILLALHGVAHFAGLTDSLEKASTNADAQYLGGLWTISEPSMLRTAGVAWAVVGAFMVAASVLVFLRHHLARRTALAALVLSLALSIVGLWGAVVGVVVNVAVLAVVVFASERVGLAGVP